MGLNLAKIGYLAAKTQAACTVPGSCRTTRKCAGQLAVELAVLIPVVIVVGLTVLNLAKFVEACAAFDRAAPSAVVAQGVSPAGESESAPDGEVRSCILDALAMPADVVDVEVESQQVGLSQRGGGGLEFPVSPLLTRYTCTLEYRPWPSSFTIAGVSYRAPLVLHHKRELVVDRYRGGVVV